MDKEALKDYIKDVPDFPKPGIVFKDISPLLASAKARTKTIELLLESVKDLKIDVIAGIESRGFLLGTVLADRLGIKFVMVRKPGKLPGKVESMPYQLEYGYDTLEIQENAIAKGERVLIHDDVLATGGTVAAAAKLVEQVGGEVVGLNFLMELAKLGGQDRINSYLNESLFKF